MLSFGLRVPLAVVLLVAGLLVAGRATAEDEFDVAVTPGKVVLNTKGKWHINKDYPWRLVVGEGKEGKPIKEKFELSERAATISAPKGPAKIHGGVCNGDQCRMFVKEVDVP